MSAVQITYHFEHTEVRLPAAAPALAPAIELRLVTDDPLKPLADSDLISARCIGSAMVIGATIWALVAVAAWLIFR